MQDGLAGQLVYDRSRSCPERPMLCSALPTTQPAFRKGTACPGMGDSTVTSSLTLSSRDDCLCAKKEKHRRRGGLRPWVVCTRAPQWRCGPRLTFSG